jgi:hypothetical protein
MAVVGENAADSLCKPLAFQTDAFKNCDSSISRQSTLFTDDEAQMSMSRMTTDTSLFSDQLPTTTTPMSLFSQEEEPVESSGSDEHWEWHAGDLVALKVILILNLVVFVVSCVFFFV